MKTYTKEQLEIMNRLIADGVPPCLLAIDEFKKNDKVVCIDDSPDYGPFGKFNDSALKLGKIYNVFGVEQYNVRGEVLYVFDTSMESCGYESKHFKLVNRDNTE